MSVPNKRLANTDFRLLRQASTLEEKRQIFKQNVTMVAIEVHSYCNRVCSFCPNSFIDRRSKTEYLNEENYIALLKGLASIDYQNAIGCSRYNEPFADPIMYKRIEQASNYLPKAALKTNTNGDYINVDNINKLIDVGLTSLNIQVYLPDEYATSKEARDDRINQIRSKLPKDITFELDFDNDSWYQLRTIYKGMEIKIRWRDFSKDGTNRCDLPVKDIIEFRDTPCRLPFHNCHIDYNNLMMPCCNLRSDYEPHKKTIYGEITSDPNSVFEAFCSNAANKFRRDMIGFKRRKSPCMTCTFGGFIKSEANLEAERKNEQKLEELKL